MKLPRDQITEVNLNKLMKQGVIEVANDIGIVFSGQTKDKLIEEILAKIGTAPPSAPVTPPPAPIAPAPTPTTDPAVISALTTLNQKLDQLGREVQQLKANPPTPPTPAPAPVFPPRPASVVAPATPTPTTTSTTPPAATPKKSLRQRLDDFMKKYW